MNTVQCVFKVPLYSSFGIIDLILVFHFPTQNMCAIEGELENLMGEFCIKMKGNCLAPHAVFYTNISARDLCVWLLGGAHMGDVRTCVGSCAGSHVHAWGSCTGAGGAQGCHVGG